MGSWNAVAFYKLQLQHLLPSHLVSRFSRTPNATQLEREDMPEQLPSVYDMVAAQQALSKLATAMGYQGTLAKGYVSYCPCRVEVQPTGTEL